MAPFIPPLEDKSTILEHQDSLTSERSQQAGTSALEISDSLPNAKNDNKRPLDAFELHAISSHLSDRTYRTSTISRVQNSSSISVHQLPIPNDALPLEEPATQAAVPEVSSTASRVEVTPQQEVQFRRKRLIHFVALCWCHFIEGCNDGSTGTLLPAIQRAYHIGFSIVALLFVSNCIGFITGAILNVYMNEKLGFGKIIVMGAISQLIGYIIIAPSPPFPVLVVGFGFIGFGFSFQNAQANGFVASLKDSMTTKLGIMHATYGLGAFLSPFLATYFSTQPHWSFHYIVLASIATSNVVVMILVFRLRKQEDILAEGGQYAIESNNNVTPDSNLYRQILGFRSVHFLTLFSLIYTGVEVTLGGWIVTFIIEKRGGGHSAGYISSGFFGGITLGRICLMWLNKLVGERIIFFYVVLAITLEITIWFVPSIIGNAVAISFIGMLLGPMFPTLISHMTHILPKRLLTGSVGFVTGIGFSGSAILPFITGILASKYGIGSLQPLMVSMMSIIVVLWAFAKGVRRVD